MVGSTRGCRFESCSDWKFEQFFWNAIIVGTLYGKQINMSRWICILQGSSHGLEPPTKCDSACGSTVRIWAELSSSAQSRLQQWSTRHWPPCSMVSGTHCRSKTSLVLCISIRRICLLAPLRYSRHNYLLFYFLFSENFILMNQDGGFASPWCIWWDINDMIFIDKVAWRCISMTFWFCSSIW